jgi:hypothetical protein
MTTTMEKETGAASDESQALFSAVEVQTGVRSMVERLEGRMTASIRCSGENAGFLEEALMQESRSAMRLMLETAMQAKADGASLTCPVCKKPLTRKKGKAERTVESRFGAVTITRARAWCVRCKSWRCPADTLLGLSEQAVCSPGMQEEAAMFVSKMPVSEAAAVMERLTGVRMSRASLSREAHRQGLRAEEDRELLDGKTAPGGARSGADGDALYDGD